jgi:hypothetical protein
LISPEVPEELPEEDPEDPLEDPSVELFTDFTDVLQAEKTRKNTKNNFIIAKARDPGVTFNNLIIPLFIYSIIQY